MDKYDLLKSHIDQYSRKDGTVVQAHDDKRVAAQAPLSTRAVGDVIGKHSSKMERKAPEWNHKGPGVPSADVSHFPEFSHKEVYGHENKTIPNQDFHKDFAANGHQGFVLKHPDGKRSVVDTQGSNYARYHAPVDDSEAAKSSAKEIDSAGSGVAPISRHAQALRESSKPGDLDHSDNQFAADHMEKGDHKALAAHLKNLDTAARDHILDHVHPDHREGLGFQQLNMDRSKKQYAEKFPVKAAKAGGPAEGEVGHEEHQQYGKYFKKGDKVKDGSGNQHTVVSHHGPEVKTESGQSFHPTKLDHAADSGFMQKPEWHHSPEHHAAVKNGFGGDKDVDVSPSKSSLGDSDVGIKHGENFISHSISPRTKSDGSKHFAVNGHAKVGGKQGPVTSAKSFPTVGDAVDHIKGVHKQFREMSK